MKHDVAGYVQLERAVGKIFKSSFQLKTFQLNDLSNCPLQLHISRYIVLHRNILKLSLSTNISKSCHLYNDYQPYLGIPEEKRKNEQSIEFVSIPFAHGNQFQQIHNLDGLTFNYEQYHTDTTPSLILSHCTTFNSVLYFSTV